MADGVKLLQELKSGGYQAALLGSFNVSFPFFEEVVLRTLRSHGCDHNVLLMDAAQCAMNLADPELAPRGAGRLYGLVPVVAPGAFHPKFILLLGKRQSKLLLGSHNLTLSGFGLNREITNALTITERSSEAIAQVVYEFALSWTQATSSEMAELVESARNWAPWLGSKRTPPERVAVLGTRPSGPCLWDQLKDRVAGDVSRVTVVGPYFDERVQFLSVLRGQFPSAELAVAVSPHRSEISPTAARSAPGIAFKDLTGWNGDVADQLVHAKLILLDYRSGESVLVSGSANPSAPAWLDVEHRNAELVLVRWLERNERLPEGLRDIAGCPEMTEPAWSLIRERRKDQADTHQAKTHAWLAFEQEAGFLVDEGFATDGDAVSVVDPHGDVVAEVKAPATVDGRRLVLVPDDDVRAVAARLRVDREGTAHLAVVQHLPELRDRATSEKRRSLHNALLDLDTKGDDIDMFLAIIERAIFDEEPVPRETGTAPSTQKKAATPTAGKIGVGELEKKGRRRQRLSTGDIGLVLDALIHKLGEGLPSDAAVATKMSEEDIDDDTEVQHHQVTVDEGKVLARRCRGKTRKLMQRMTKRLELAWDEMADPFAVVVQLAASIGLLHRLTERKPKLDWLPRGEELIELEHHWALLKEAAVVIFAPENGIAGGLLEKHGEFSELASSAALVLWSAWTSGLDITKALISVSAFDADEDDGEEQVENLLGLGVLLNCLDRDLLPPEPELEHIFGENGLEWLERHLAWAEEVTTAPPKPAVLSAGSVVQFHRHGEKDVGVVVAAAEGKVEVVDRMSGERRRYSEDRVRWVGAVDQNGARQ